MHQDHLHYEIVFDVPGRNRESFERWLSADAIGWLNHDSVASFEVFQNDTGLSPELKFVFGFESVQDWACFVNTDEHESTMHRLETLVDNREAVLWQRASLKLDDTVDGAVGDGGPRALLCLPHGVSK